MPEYLAPGVFVEEVSFRAKSIEGVGTSVAAVVGPTRTGPLRGKPEVVTSFGEFSRTYGDIKDLNIGGKAVLNHTAIAAKAFFDGGGKQLYVARIGNYGVPDGKAKRSDSSGFVTFKSRFPGMLGNYTLELVWRDSENLLRTVPTSTPGEDEIVFVEAKGLTAANLANVTVPDTLTAPLTVRALVQRDGADYLIMSPKFIIADATKSVSVATADDAAIRVPDPAGRTLAFTRVSLKQPTKGALDDGSSAAITLVKELVTTADFFDLAGGNWGTKTTIFGNLDTAHAEFDVSAAPVNVGVTAFSFPLAALAAAPGSVEAVVVQRTFDINVRSGDKNGPVVYIYGNMSTAPTGATSLAKVMVETPDKRYDVLTSPVSCTLKDGATGDNIMSGLRDMFDPVALNPTGINVDGPRYLISLRDGTDGNTLTSVDYGGAENEVAGSTGLVALEDIEDISIVMTPAAAADPDNHQAIVNEVQKHCRKMRYRVGIVDSQDNMTLAQIRDFRSNFADSRLALYYPWVVISDPRGITSTITVPAAGFVAGVYANTDVQRGVHKPPANEPVIGALRFAMDVNRFQQELLNPDGINCLRSFPGRGHRVWGGRTLSDDPEWKYVNVRRYFLYLERSIEKSTQWVVFEPNGEALWDNVRATVDSFLYNEWRNGRLLGSDKTAYFVRCDRSTMTQNDLDNGRLVCEIGVAALKPAEFVIFRIGQKTADA